MTTLMQALGAVVAITVGLLGRGEAWSVAALDACVGVVILAAGLELPRHDRRRPWALGAAVVLFVVAGFILLMEG